MARPPMRPRSVKVDDDLWIASLKAAEILRTDVSTEIRAGLRALVKRAARVATHPDARPATPTDTEETINALPPERRRDLRVARPYPEGWEGRWAPIGNEDDGTRRVGFAGLPRDDVARLAREVEAATGVPLEVFADGDGDWCFRPAARTPLTLADIPAGQGAASLFLMTRHRPGSTRSHWQLIYKREDGTLAPQVTPAGPEDAAFAVLQHLAATLPTIDTTEESK